MLQFRAIFESGGNYFLRAGQTALLRAVVSERIYYFPGKEFVDPVERGLKDLLKGKGFSRNNPAAPLPQSRPINPDFLPPEFALLFL